MAAASSHQHVTSQHICKNCNKSFPLHYMYACFHGHYLCSGCYHRVHKESQYSINGLSGTNSEHDIAQSSHLLNQTSFYNDPLEEKSSQSIERKQNMFPNPSVYQQNTIDSHNSLISLASICKPSLLNLSVLSKRPIICPQYDCRKTIGVSFLHMHFYHEHKQVATIVTQLETRNCLEFNFADLKGKIRNICLVLITLEQRNNACNIQDEGIQKVTNSKTSRGLLPLSKPFYILVAAKMPTDCKEEENEDNDNEKEFQPWDRVFFYVTSNMTTNYSYTIAASTPSQNIRIKYFGPVLPVNEEFQKLCEDGKGLVLNHHQINGMGNYCNQSVNLDLIIHERDDQINYLIND